MRTAICIMQLTTDFLQIKQTQPPKSKATDVAVCIIQFIILSGFESNEDHCRSFHSFCSMIHSRSATLASSMHDRGSWNRL